MASPKLQATFWKKTTKKTGNKYLFLKQRNKCMSIKNKGKRNKFVEVNERNAESKHF